MTGQVNWVTVTSVLLLAIGLVECNPRSQKSYGSVVGFSEPAFSASSYDSLGIQPSRTGRNQNTYWWQGPQSPFSEGAALNHGISSANRPQQTVVGCSGDGCSSPLFSGPAVSASSAQISSGSGGSCCNHYWQKPGHPCSNHQGNDCPRTFSCVHYRSCSNGVISHGSSSGYSQKPSLNELMSYGRPCGYSGKEVCCQEAPRPQPVVEQPSHTYYPPAPSPPPREPVIQHPSPIYYPPATQPPPPKEPVIQPQPPIYYPPATTRPPTYYPPATQPPTTKPVYYPPPVYTTTPAPKPVYTPAPPAYYPPAPVFTTTTPRPVYTPAPPTFQPATRPPPPPPTQASVAQGPPANLLPYPGCAAALKCVLEEYCSIDGIMINTPVFLTSQQKEYRTPLMACLNTETNQVGFCCRDPLYNDPWPADMPMPGMPKPPVEPVVVQPSPPPPPPPTQPPFIQCYPNEDCVSAHVCSQRQQPFNNQPNAKCQSYHDGQVGVCCPRPPPTTTTTTPPPPPPTQPVVIPPDSYLPPPVQPVVVQTTPPPPPPPTQPPFIQCYPNEDCVSAQVCSQRQQPFIDQPNAKCQSYYDGQVGVCCPRPPPTTTTTTTTTTTPPPPTQPPFIQCYPNEDCVSAHVCSQRQQPFIDQPNAKCQSYYDGQVGVCCPRPPPTTTTTTTPPPPPPTQPVVVPPDSYLPPPVQPVEVPSDSYLPPPPPPVEILPPPQEPVVEQSYIPPPPPQPAAQVVDHQCGISRPVLQQLNNGEAALGEFPWHAMIAQLNGSMSCSGALIGPKFVATSFHCVQGISPSNLRVRLGEQRVGATDEPLPHYEIPVAAVIGHPDFAEGSLFHDTAVLMLAAAAPTGQAHISPICLPQQSEPQVSECVVSGWGHDTLSGLQIGMLNKIQVSVVRNSDCQNALQSTHLGKYFKLHKSFTCASTQNSINPCKVDGGSPLACKRPDGSHVLIGLSSWSVGCSNQQQPGVYADVTAVAPWMEQQMAKPEASLVEQSESAFQTQQQFQTEFGTGAGYGR